MTDNPPADRITTAEEFEDALGDLLATATENGVDPRGSWVHRDGDGSGGDWETVIYELAHEGSNA